MESLDDSNSVYMTKDEYAEYRSEIKGDMSGVGIEYEKTSKSQIKITRVYSGSPAKNQGLKKGDVIYEIDRQVLKNQVVMREDEIKIKEAELQIAIANLARDGLIFRCIINTPPLLLLPIHR